MNKKHIYCYKNNRGIGCIIKNYFQLRVLHQDDWSSRNGGGGGERTEGGKGLDEGK